MDVYKRADGRSPFWQYDITMPDGSRKRCSTRERDKAKARKAMLAALGEAKAEAEAPKVSKTLHAAVWAYVEGLAADGKVWHRTAAIIAHRIFGTGTFADAKRFHLPTSLRIDQLDDDTLRKLRVARKAEGLTPGSIGHELKVLRAATRIVRERPPIDKWAVPQSAPKMRWLTPEEWAAIYAELDPQRPMKHTRNPDELVAPTPHIIAERAQTRALFVALTLCGGRWGEVTRLTTDTILPGGRVRLYGRKTGRERIVPLPPMAAEAIEAQRARAASQGTPYLFPANSTTKPGRREASKDWQTGSGAIKRAFERAKVNAPHKVERDGRATIHSLRHTFASWCLQAGMTLSEVQELLGHTTISMTSRYSHLATGVAVERATTVLSGITSSLGAFGG